VAEVAAAEAAAADSAAAVEAVAAAEAAAAVEAAAAAGAAAKAAADAPDTEAALQPELLKEPGGGADGMAEDAEEVPGWPMFSVGAREELKTRGPRGIENSRRVDQQRGSKRGSPDREINTDQVLKITPVQ
jgi:RecA/RadA recombinase